MGTFLSLLGSGVAEGSVAALVALGFLLVHRSTGVVNFAQGDLVTLAAYLGVWANVDLSLPPVPAYAVAIAAMFVVGVVLERLAYAPLRGRSVHVVVISTFGAGLIIRTAVSIWKGAFPQTLDSPFKDRLIRFGGAVITGQRVAIIVAAAVLVGLLAVLLALTSFGRKLRAIADDIEMAQGCGVRVRLYSMLAFGLSGALSGVAGVLYAPVGIFDPTLGVNVMFTAFAAAVVAGWGSVGGVIVAAIALASVENVIGGYWLRDFKTAYPLILMVAVLAIRPQGLFGKRLERY